MTSNLSPEFQALLDILDEAHPESKAEESIDSFTAEGRRIYDRLLLGETVTVKLPNEYTRHRIQNCICQIKRQSKNYAKELGIPDFEKKRIRALPRKDTWSKEFGGMVDFFLEAPKTYPTFTILE